jgi:hypothetical protein
MPINSNIPLGIQPFKTEVQDPIAEQVKLEQLKGLLTQQRAQEQSSADEQAQRQAFQQSGGDQAAYLKALASQGNVRAYQAAQEQAAKAAHLGAQTEQAKGAAAKSFGEAAKNDILMHRDQLANVSNPQSAAEWIKSGYESPVTGPILSRTMPIEDAISRIPTDPVLFQQWKQQAAMGATKFAEQQEQTRHNKAQEGLTARGQNMVDARSRMGQDIGKIPPGFRRTETGDLEAIPGGPADLKKQGAFNQDTAALTGSVNSFDRLATAANEVLNHPGLKGISGIRGAIPNVPGTQAADAQALLGTLKSQVGFGVLQDMRNNSKTGGALGAVSDAEGKRLEANLAALDKSQSLEQFQSNLKKIIDYSEQAKGRVREAYNMKHGGTSAPATPAKTNAGATVSNW